MKSNSIKLLAIGAVAMFSTFNASAETLRVGMECTYAPFNYKTAAGELAGYDVDVAKGVAKIIGADLEYVCQEWDGMIPALSARSAAFRRRFASTRTRNTTPAAQRCARSPFSSCRLGFTTAMASGSSSPPRW